MSSEWETEIYARGRQVNRWPFSDLVADVTRMTADVDRTTFAVLDLGCGTGNNVRFLLDSGFEVCGIDIAPTAISTAADFIRSLGLPVPDLRVGDVADLPWPADRFDIVLDRGVLSQLTLDDLGRAISEVVRVLKPGGLFLSYNLFGSNDSGKDFGIEVAPHSYAGFTAGRFHAKSPLTTFFDRQLIIDTWRPLRVAELIRHQVTVDGADGLSEYYTVHAVKD